VKRIWAIVMLLTMLTGCVCAESAETAEPEEISMTDAVEEAVAEVTEEPEEENVLPPEDESKIFTFSLIGDCTVGEQVQHQGYQSGYTYKISQAGLDYPFSLVADMFAKDDLTVANCEGCLTNYKVTKKQVMALIAPPEFAEVFKLGNVDVCNLANNHAKDFGNRGQQETAENLQALGIGVFYDDVMWTTEIKGVKIGFVGFTYPMYESKLKKYTEALQKLRDEGCGFVVASAHWGRETYYDLDANQKYAVKLIDAGFDMVYGHGSHTCQMIRWYKGKVIFYSLSNFTFGANSKPKDDDTVVVQIRYDIQDDGTMTARDMTAIPFKMAYEGDFRPYPIEDQEGKERVWTKLYQNGYPKAKKSPAPSLPESFLTTGYVDFRELEITEE